MKYSGVFASTLVFSLAAAVPLNQQRDVVVQTSYVEVTQTIPCTKTVYVDTNGKPIAAPAATSSPSGAQFFQSSAAMTLSVVASSSRAASSPVASSSAAAPVAVSSSAPASSSPTPVVSTSVYTPPAASTPATSSPAPVSSAPAPSSAAPAASATPSSSSGGSGTQYSGDMTFYTAGLGACGWTNDGSSEHVVALPHGFMGEQSNGNPYCGKMITINYGGKSTTAKVVDKCMGCEGMSIDLSTSAFDALCDEAKGRVQATWSFNE